MTTATASLQLGNEDRGCAWPNPSALDPPRRPHSPVAAAMTMTSPTARIAGQRLTRWLAPRLQRDDLLQRAARHTLIHPVRHGARVCQVEEHTDQLPLFGPE